MPNASDTLPITDPAAIKEVAVLIESSPGSPNRLARRVSPAVVAEALAGATAYDSVTFVDVTKTTLLSILGVTATTFDAAMAGAGAVPAGPALTILSVTPSTAGSTATAEFRYDRGKPTNTITATLGGNALTLASVALDNISSGSGATATGFGRVTFVQPSAGTRSLVLTASGTNGSTSAPFSVVTTAPAVVVSDGAYTFEAASTLRMQSPTEPFLEVRIRRTADGQPVTPSNLPSPGWVPTFGISTSTTVPPSGDFTKEGQSYDNFWYRTNHAYGPGSVTPPGTYYPWVKTPDDAAHCFASSPLVFA